MWGQFLQFYESSGLDGVGLNGGKQTEINCTRITLKVIPPILWCWHMTSEADVGDTAVEAETSYQYSITCCCCMTDGSRGASWHNGAWHGSAYGRKGVELNSSMQNNLHPLSFIDVCGMLMETNQWMRPQWGTEWSISAVVTAGHLHWCIFTSAACRLLYIIGENI